MSGHNSKKRPISSRGRGYVGRAAHDSGRVAGTVKGFPRPDNSSPSIRSGVSTVGNLPIDTSGLGFTGLPSNNTSQAVPNWLSWLSAFQGREGYNFDTLLSALGGNSNNPLISLISALGFNQSGDIKESQASDWNKQLLDQILSYVNTLDDRNYKQGVLNEQRLYDNPQNQLARLMGAGISRDAAFQLLGQSNQPFAAEAAAVPTGTAPSQSELANKEGIGQVANVAFGAISAFSSLVGLGFSVAQSAQQVKLLKSQSYMSQQQMKAYQTANSVFNVLQGIDADADAYGSVKGALGAIQTAAQGGNELAKSFLTSPESSYLTAGGVFVAPVLAQMYKDNRNASDYKERWYAEMTNLNFQNKKLDGEVGKLAAETKNLGETYKEIIAQTDFIEEQKKVQTQTIEYLKSQGRLAEADAYAQELENNVTQGWQDMTFTDAAGNQQTGLWFASSSVLYKMVNAYDIGLAQSDPDYRDYLYEQILVDQQASYYAAFLLRCNNLLGADFVLKHPAHAQYYNGLKAIGYYEYSENIANGVYETNDHATSHIGPLGEVGVNYGGTVVQSPSDDLSGGLVGFTDQFKKEHENGNISRKRRTRK